MDQCRQRVALVGEAAEAVDRGQCAGGRDPKYRAIIGPVRRRGAVEVAIAGQEQPLSGIMAIGAVKAGQRGLDRLCAGQPREGDEDCEQERCGGEVTSGPRRDLCEDGVDGWISSF